MQCPLRRTSSKNLESVKCVRHISACMTTTGGMVLSAVAFTRTIGGNTPVLCLICYMYTIPLSHGKCNEGWGLLMLLHAVETEAYAKLKRGPGDYYWKMACTVMFPTSGLCLLSYNLL